MSAFTLYRKSQGGFSLIELMVVVAILGVVVAFAYPRYQDYVTRTQRTDGIAKLQEIMQTQERYYAENLTYAGSFTDLAGYSSPVASENGHYEITNSDMSACGSTGLSECVEITASPVSNAQKGDSDLVMSSRGDKNWCQGTRVEGEEIGNNACD